jgi:hypothetical protein
LLRQSMLHHIHMAILSNLHILQAPFDLWVTSSPRH